MNRYTEREFKRVMQQAVLAGQEEGIRALDQSVGKELQKRFPSEARKRKRRFTYRLIASAAVMAVALTISAFSTPSVADRIYGSYEIAKRTFVTVTMQQYQKVGFKFMGAKKMLGADYPKFEKLAKAVIAAKVAYGNDAWQIDVDALPAAKQAEVRQLFAEVQSYFDRLNELGDSRAVLTPEQYTDYTDSILRQETLLAQSGLNPSKGSIEVKNLPKAIQPEYKQVVDRIRYFERQIGLLSQAAYSD
ncbi:hypothetical protein SY83_19020 [Paenibacillus swuensis]|uniref:DUF3600 domain-containing protein n=1 Tax=Paenibacillus swuensis TaxID=1178515 RepID=A0A172TLX9_9BACL|nr:DUF3600 domain-containing protein [Paenibacillus swuensis]ANE48038.1 hypothetical protein SY83_19020 [Paenibacillus swuensis]